MRNIVVSSLYDMPIACLADDMALKGLSSEVDTTKIKGDTFYTVTFNNVTDAYKEEIMYVVSELQDKYADLQVTVVKIGNWSMSGLGDLIDPRD